MTTSDDGFVIWLTGLPAAGKSALAHRLAEALAAQGRTAVVLDEDRDGEQAAALAAEAGQLARGGAVAIAAAVSPSRAVRDDARRAIGRFVEVFVDCPLEVCVGRDRDGRYGRALTGELPRFPGISAPYEVPRAPEVVVPSGSEGPEAAARRVLGKAARLGYLPVGPGSPGSNGGDRSHGLVDREAKITL